MKNTLTQSAVGTLFALGSLVAFAPVASAEMAPWVGPDAVACTQEAKACPDGSYVGRTGPNCAFAACPGSNTDAVNGVYPTYGDDARWSTNVDGSVTVTDQNTATDDDAVNGVYPTYGDDAKTGAEAGVTANADGSPSNGETGFFVWVSASFWYFLNLF